MLSLVRILDRSDIVNELLTLTCERVVRANGVALVVKSPDIFFEAAV